MDSSRGGSRQVIVVMLTLVVVVVLLLLLPALSISLSRSLSLRSGRFHSNHVQHKTSLDCK